MEWQTQRVTPHGFEVRALLPRDPLRGRLHKTLTSLKRRALLTARKLLQEKADMVAQLEQPSEWVARQAHTSHEAPREAPEASI